MATIIRFQNENGDGLYNCSNRDRKLNWNDADYTRHPAPSEDSLLVENAPHLFKENTWGLVFRADSFVFGFKNYEQARSWLYKDSWLHEADQKGFRAYIMEGEVYYGNSQAVINRDTAKIIQDLSIPEFLAANNVQENPCT